MARRTNSPWSKTYKEGLPTTAVNDHVNIDQNVNATITTGVIDSLTGQWQGITVTDDNFIIDAVHEAVPNGSSVLCPQATPDYIDMTGFKDLIFAIKPTNGGNYGTTAVMGPDSHYYTNLTPIVAAAALRGSINDGGAPAISNILLDGAELCTANKWNIFYIGDRVRGQKLMQLQLLNSSGGESDIQFAYLRVV